MKLFSCCSSKRKIQTAVKDLGMIFESFSRSNLSIVGFLLLTRFRLTAFLSKK